MPTGHIVYARAGTLHAVAFDMERLALTGRAVPVVRGVRAYADVTGAAEFSVSSEGSLVYVPGPTSNTPERAIALIDREGIAKRLDIPAGPYTHPRIAPDGTRLAFGTDSGDAAEIWIYDLAGTTAMRRLTFAGANRYAMWSPDSTRVAFPVGSR